MTALKILLGAAAAATLASGAHATVLASENFESYSPTVHGDGVYDLNFNSFTQGFHPTDGTVDLIGTPNAWALSGASNFIDLDGSTGNGAIFRSDAFTFNAGDTITLSFSLAGNQRGGTDQWDFGFQTTGGNIDFTNIVLSGPGISGLGSSATGPAIGSGQGALPFNSAWNAYSMSFKAGNAGSFTAYIGTTSADNIGPLVDDINLTKTGAVPEPATWALMIGGFGLAGATLRRRRAVAATA
jgi:hypothetical protein